VSCQNLQCDYYVKNNVYNAIDWEGVVKNPLEEGEQLVAGTTFVCRHCKLAPICIARNLAKIDYVLHHSKMMTLACIHFGTHEHLVVIDPSRDNKDMAHDLIRQEYENTLTATPLAIAMSTNKVFLGPNNLLGLVMNHNPSCKGKNLIYYYKSFPL
jgi:hypothetical protein